MYPLKKCAMYFSKILKDLCTENWGKLPRKFGLHFSHVWKICILKKQATEVVLVGWFGKCQSMKKVGWRRFFNRRFVSGSTFVSPCPPECYFQSETKNGAWSQVMKFVLHLLNYSGFGILVVRTTLLFLLRTGDPKKRRSLGRRMGFGLCQSVSCPFC